MSYKLTYIVMFGNGDLNDPSEEMEGRLQNLTFKDRETCQRWKAEVIHIQWFIKNIPLSAPIDKRREMLEQWVGLVKALKQQYGWDVVPNDLKENLRIAEGCLKKLAKSSR